MFKEEDSQNEKEIQKDQKINTQHDNKYSKD